MELEELEITIPLDGTIQVHVSGMKGSRCIAVTKGLEEAVGTLIARTCTPVYYSHELKEKVQQIYNGNDCRKP